MNGEDDTAGAPFVPSRATTTLISRSVPARGREPGADHGLEGHAPDDHQPERQLVVAYLDRRHAEWLGLLEERTERAGSAVERVLAVFDAYLDHAELAYAHGFRGCGLLNGAAELPTGHPGRETVRAHKDEVRRIIIERCAAAEAPNPEQLGEHLYLLVEGGVVSAGLEGDPNRLQRARSLAQLILSEK